MRMLFYVCVVSMGTYFILFGDMEYMKMKVTISGNVCTVTREPGDQKYYGVVNAAGESRLLHAIKTNLNAQGGNFIKKRMWRDGHLVDDMQQYVRSADIYADDAIGIYNPHWAVCGAESDYNEGEVVLAVHYFNR